VGSGQNLNGKGWFWVEYGHDIMGKGRFWVKYGHEIKTVLPIFRSQSSYLRGRLGLSASESRRYYRKGSRMPLGYRYSGVALSLVLLG
jgi:hypothetical protein